MSKCVYLILGHSVYIYIYTGRFIMFSLIANVYNKKTKGLAIFSLHTLASPSGRNVNYDDKQLTGKKLLELFLLSIQVS